MSTSNDVVKMEKQHSLIDEHSYDCTVDIPDGSSLNFYVEKSAKGEVLMNKVVQHLKIRDKEYFGLQFFNDKGLQIWLDIHKSMKHQIGDLETAFALRIKFYESEITRVKDEYTRYLLYLQVRKDIISGKLLYDEETYAVLGSYTVQAELGDFHHSKFDHSYLDEYEFSTKQFQSPALIKKIKDYHKALRGKTTAQSEVKFLEEARKNNLYGLDTFSAQDVEGPIVIGIGASGIQVIRRKLQEISFRWQNLETLLYNRRKFTVKLKKHINDSKDDSNNKKQKLVYVYYFESAKGCKQCYKSAVENHSFYRLSQPDVPRKKSDSLKLRSSFRYSDRTLYQIRHKSNLNESDRNSRKFQRTASKRQPSLSFKVANAQLKTAEAHNIQDDNSGVQITCIDGKKPGREPSVQYEEIEIDESNPDDALFDHQDWEVFEKTFADGTRKRVRRRVIQTTVIHTINGRQQPADSNDVKQESKKQQQEIVIHAEQCYSENFQNVTSHDDEGNGIDNSSDTSMDIIKPYLNLNMDDLLQEISEMSKSLDEQEKVMQRPTKMEVVHVSIEEDLPLCDGKLQQSIEEEKQPEVSASVDIIKEKKMVDDLNATFDSIFTLSDDEDEKNHEVHINTNFEDLVILPLRGQLECVSMEHHPVCENDKSDDVDDAPFEYVSVTDAQYFGLDDNAKIQTALLMQQKKDESKMTCGSDESAVSPNEAHGFDGQIPFHCNSDFVKASNCGDSQWKCRSNAEIIYTVTDVSNVEQGGMGFVRSVTAKHEHIATEEEKSARRSSKVFNENTTTPKGHVPTRTVSFKASEKVIHTKSPPAVAVKPTVIIPASSELPDEEIFFTTNQVPEESHQSLEVHSETMKKVPNIETQTVTFEATNDSMDYRIAPVASDLTVDTRVVKIIMHKERSVTSDTEAASSDPAAQIITETVTIESDDPSLTTEQLQKLIDRTHADIPSSSTATNSENNINVIGERTEIVQNINDDEEETEI